MASDGLPSTIYNKTRFEEAQWYIDCPYCGDRIGFDGVFDWSWMLDLLPRGITPTDLDGVLELGDGHFLVFETKKIEVRIQPGQQSLLKKLHRAKSFVVIRMWLDEENGVKRQVHHFDWIKRNGEDSGATLYGEDEARAFLKRWLKHVEPNTTFPWERINNA